MIRIHAVILTTALALVASDVVRGSQAGTQQPTTPQPTIRQPTTQQPTTERPTSQQPTTQQPRTQQPTSGDTAATSSGSAGFAQKAAMGGMKEVETARFVAGKTTNQDVKAYAERLVKDHSAANSELMGLMKTKNFAAGTEPTSQPEAWRNQSGAAFDRAYVDQAIREHEMTIAMFEAESKSGTDPQVKAWAAQKLPALRDHLKAAQDLKTKLGPSTR